MSARTTFKKNDWVVYPTHGVGKVTGIEDQEIEGFAEKFLIFCLIKRPKPALKRPGAKVVFLFDSLQYSV